MGTREFGRVAAILLCVWSAIDCNETKKEQSQPQASVATTAPSAVTPPNAAEPAPEGCKAKGDKPFQVGTVLGDLYGFAGDATHLYCATWQVYGGRGDLSRIRKDGQGSQPLAALKLEPRGLALDKNNVYFTSGIRLNSVPKAGGTANTLDAQFSSQSIAADEKAVYGVPGNYGPYDRVAKIGNTGGESIEIASVKRPNLSTAPNGYNAIALDDSGAYVADSGNGRILKFPLAPGKPQAVATGLKKPFDLAIDSSNVYFTLAGGELMMVSKAGGKVTKLLSGLMENARIAADSGAIYSTLAGKDGGASLARVTQSDGSVTKIAAVPETHLVSAVALDKDCVYWAERFDATKSVIYALRR
jgi:hypothetical protein